MLELRLVIRASTSRQEGTQVSFQIANLRVEIYYSVICKRFTTLLFVKAAKSCRGPEVGSAEEGNHHLLNRVWCLQVIEQ